MIRARTLLAVRWALVDTVFRQGLFLVFTVILARLLTPEQFGVVAMLGLFVGVGYTLVEGGMGAALIQAEAVTQVDKSTVFFLQLGMGITLGVSLAASGHLLALFFSQPMLAPMAAAFGANLVIQSLAGVHASLANKDLDLKTPAIIALVAQLVSGGVAVTAAWRGAGAWAVVIQTLLSSSITTVLFWTMVRWQPSAVFSTTSFQRLFGFGAYVAGTGLMFEIESRIGALLVGRMFGSGDLGQFQRAASTQLVLTRLLSGVVTRVAFPAFAAVQSRRTKLISAVREATFVNFSVLAPIMWGIALAAEPLVRMVFGSVWSPAAPALVAFCVAGAFHPVYTVPFKALRAVGASRVVFILQAFKAAGAVSVVLLTARYGFVVMAWSQAAFTIAGITLHVFALSRRTGYSMIDQAKDLWPVLGAGAAMAATAMMLRPWLVTLPDPLHLALLCLAAAAVYAGTLLTLVRLTPTPASRGATMTVTALGAQALAAMRRPHA